MIRDFEEWTAPLSEVAQMNTLRGSVIGIEASDYLDRLDRFHVPVAHGVYIREPLTPALGGTPFGLKAIFRSTIAAWRAQGITPLFVFSGLNVGKSDSSIAGALRSAQILTDAWLLYDKNDPKNAVDMFRKSTAVTPEDLFRLLQTALREEGVEFIVAPYGAYAQLSYLYQSKTVDAVAGSSEILLFDVPDVITSWNFEQSDFTWVKRQGCVADLGALSSDLFVDACLLSGTSFLPTFPPLNSVSVRKQPKMKSALEMIMNTGKSGYAACLQYENDPQCQALKYLDKYCRARSSIRFHAVMNKDGKAEAFDVGNAPGDVHEFLSSRLSDELYFYMSKGVISPRVLNWITSGEIVELPPLDGGESEEYRALVRDQLKETRSSCLSLLVSTVHRFYGHRDIKLRYWFDGDNQSILRVRDLEDPLPVVREWNVREDVYGPEKNHHWGKSGLIGIAVKTMKNNKFCPQTIAKKDVNNLLKSKEEILFNSVWRMLHLRGYINRDHTLSQWGEVLCAALDALPTLPPDKASVIVELEESVVVAVELARLGLLNADEMFPTYTGAPYRGSAADKRHTLLISRIGCLGKISHQEIGYTGPLSRHYLGYHSMVTAVRGSLRDLLEVCLANLLLFGDSERNRTDYVELGLEYVLKLYRSMLTMSSLPFAIQNDCALALEVNSYLDEVTSLNNPSSPEAKRTAKERNKEKLFRFATDYDGDLQKVFQLWDALYSGLKLAGGELFAETQLFDEANKWLKNLR